MEKVLESELIAFPSWLRSPHLRSRKWVGSMGREEVKAEEERGALR